MEAITMKSSGIKCDAPGCGYRNERAKLEDLELYRNEPCPDCGANLLTDDDYFTAKAMLAATTIINEVVGDVPETD